LLTADITDVLARQPWFSQNTADHQIDKSIGVEMDTALHRSPKPKSRHQPDQPFQRSQHDFLLITVVGVYPTAPDRVLTQESDSQARSPENPVHPIIQSADDWSDHPGYHQQWTG
jgi:hypothetical protein